MVDSVTPDDQEDAAAVCHISFTTRVSCIAANYPKRITLAEDSPVTDVEGTSYDDIITGNARDNTLEGGNGNDTIVSGGGDDILLGMQGADMFVISNKAATYPSPCLTHLTMAINTMCWT